MGICQSRSVGCASDASLFVAWASEASREISKFIAQGLANSAWASANDKLTITQGLAINAWAIANVKLVIT